MWHLEYDNEESGTTVTLKFATSEQAQRHKTRLLKRNENARVDVWNESEASSTSDANDKIEHPQSAAVAHAPKRSLAEWNAFWNLHYNS
jgi:hypothetical protein